MFGLREALLGVFIWLQGGPSLAEQGPEAAPVAAVDAIVCDGVAAQAGLLICTAPEARSLTVSGPGGEAERIVPVDAMGTATIGVLRSETPVLRIRADTPALAEIEVDIAPREDAFRVIEGLDCDKVDARTEAQKAHAARSWVKKQDAFQRFERGPGASAGFMRPSEGRTSSPFGPARKYVGVGADGEPCEKTSIHYGYDIAIPVGTEIVAPAGGVVTLGDPDLYYEGGTVFLDHGDGLVSVFMHMSEVQVAAGDTVAAGDLLGLSGNTGRTTGPHLHWAVKWRNPGSTDRSRDFYIDPALLLQLKGTTGAP